jgi:hypothetical protein
VVSFILNLIVLMSLYIISETKTKGDKMTIIVDAGASLGSLSVIKMVVFLKFDLIIRNTDKGIIELGCRDHAEQAVEYLKIIDYPDAKIVE